MTKTKPADAHTPEERAAILARFEASGLSLRAFAASIGLPAGTLSHWRWRRRNDAPPADQALVPAAPTLLPVTVTT